ncbi:hypothetical protein BJY52DRAFT_1231833 [Lactarius psammicola]|nr:hypothetical protein BJY52DRAFT_1231833 [Lactarius psammicola]
MPCQHRLLSQASGLSTQHALPEPKRQKHEGYRNSLGELSHKLTNILFPKQQEDGPFKQRMIVYTGAMSDFHVYMMPRVNIVTARPVVIRGRLRPQRTRQGAFLSVTALVRRPETIGRVAALGPHLCADVVVNAACSDDLALYSAILAGQRKRVEADGTCRPCGTLVHTSDGAISLDPKRAEAYDLKGEIWNGQVDVPYVSILTPAGRRSKSDLSCVPFVSFFLGLKDLANWRGRPVPATEPKRACYLSESTNMLYLADVNDLVDLYLRVFDRVLTGADKDVSPYERYYIQVGAVNALSFKAVMTAVRLAACCWRMARQNRLSSTRFQIRGCRPTLRDCEADPPGHLPVLQSFSRMCAATYWLEPMRGKSIGWNPSHMTSSVPGRKMKGGREQRGPARGLIHPRWPVAMRCVVARYTGSAPRPGERGKW